ncbi:Uncharacterised protein [Legionella beliardensis]|uniref:Transposase n=1 Tax=Legionella beliardensis TaxID=91822 RepID=A0A378I4V2_9GAMM|nr:Uncharacterised protein [Legionella beliardensis]
MPDGTYFFTLALRKRKLKLLICHTDLLGESFRKMKQNYPL